MSTNDPNDPKRTGGVHGDSTVTPLAKKKGGMGWLWPLLGLLALLLLLFLLMRSCGHRDTPVTNTTTTTETTTTNTMSEAPAVPATPPVDVKQVTLPGGRTVGLAPNTLNYALQEYLASSAPAPRRFTFDRLTFATGSAELPADAQDTIGALQQILAAYPKAKVRIEGYADARGGEQANAKLGAARANAVKTALTGAGLAANRIETATGGETNPVGPNETSPGQAENRRTDLVVVSK